MRRIAAGAAIKRGTESVGETADKRPSTASGTAKGRMVHIRLAPELHRKLRLVVAARDTTLQEWIARMLEDAADRAWSEGGEAGGFGGAGRNALPRNGDDSL